MSALTLIGGPTALIEYGPFAAAHRPARRLPRRPAHVLGVAVIAPIHRERWTHFTASLADPEAAFAAAGPSDRLRPVAPGETVSRERR